MRCSVPWCCSRPRSAPPRPTTARRGPWSPVRPRASAPPRRARPPRAASTCCSPPAARNSCGQDAPVDMGLLLDPWNAHFAWAAAWLYSGSWPVHGVARMPRSVWHAYLWRVDGTCIQATVWPCIQATTALLFILAGGRRPDPRLQLRRARRDRAVRPGARDRRTRTRTRTLTPTLTVTLTLTLTLTRRATGVATLCAAAERRDVTLAVLNAGYTVAAASYLLLPTCY